MQPVHIVGGGFAGSEAAWQIASRGVPVVVSSRGSLPEVAGDAAVLVDPNDVAEISQAIQNLLAAEHLRKSLRSRGLARAQQFTWDRAAAETWQVLENAAN